MFFVIDFLILLVIQGLEYSEIVTVLVVAGKDLLCMSCRRRLNFFIYISFTLRKSFKTDQATNHESEQHA